MDAGYKPLCTYHDMVYICIIQLTYQGGFLQMWAMYNHGSNKLEKARNFGGWPWKALDTRFSPKKALNLPPNALNLQPKGPKFTECVSWNIQTLNICPFSPTTIHLSSQYLFWLKSGTRLISILHSPEVYSGSNSTLWDCPSGQFQTACYRKYVVCFCP